MEVAADAVWKSVLAEVKLHFGKFSPPPSKIDAAALGWRGTSGFLNCACAPPAGRADVTTALILPNSDQLNINQDLMK